ncbi:hypothetical protein [Oleidesulfovibrio sp.]|uniref:hypothetical protein n=1 Tax=Oleidesulfovibrio sp. TaxID=2909707 RepID=UPI003A86B4E2
MTYRRKNGSDTWYFCKNCTAWPDKDFDERTTKPTTGELCNQCKAKAENNNCTK